MNRYPQWKYLLIITIILVSALYALPNLYPSDPAIQVTSSKGQVFDDQFTQRINLLLKEKMSELVAELEKSSPPSQWIDIQLDQIFYSYLLREAKMQKNHYLINLFQIQIDLNNIRTFLRVKQMQKEKSFRKLQLLMSEYFILMIMPLIVTSLKNCFMILN